MGDAEASLMLTLLPPAVLLLLLAARLHPCVRAGRRPCRRPTLALAASLLLGLGCACSALLVEPHLWCSHAPSPAWPPAAPAVVGAVGWAVLCEPPPRRAAPPHAALHSFLPPAAGLLVPLTSEIEAQSGRHARSQAFSVAACAARLLPIVFGLARPSSRAHLLPWLPVEAGLLALTLLVGCITSGTPRTLTSAPGCEPLNASLVAVGVSSSARELERVRWDAEQREMERVLPRGLGLCSSVAELWRQHHRMLEEARAMRDEASKADEVATSTTASSQDHERDKEHHTIWHYLWTCCPKVYLFPGLVCSLFLTASSFGTPYVQGVLFDVAVNATFTNGTTIDEAWDSQVLPLLGAVAGLQASTWLFEVLVGTLYALAAHTALTRLRIRMFHNLVQQDAAFFDAHVSGELSSRLINDSGALQSLAQFTSQNLVQAAVRVLGSIVAMFVTHPLLALLATLVTPVNWFIVHRAGEVSGLYGVVQNGAMAKANAQAVEVLGAMRTVQASTAELREARRFSERINRFLKVVIVTVQCQTAVIFAQLGLSKVRDVLVLGFGMHQVLAGNLTIGSFTAFTTYVSLYEQGFLALANIWLNTKQTLIAAGRFLQLMERQPAILAGVGDSPSSCLGLLEFRNVTFAYPAGIEVPVLRGLSFTVEPGTVVALVGASGAGKSTVGRLIERFYDPQHGALLLDGADYRTLDFRWLRRQIGLVEQEPVLFDCSLLENIKYGNPEASDKCAQTAAERANAHEFIRSLPNGYASMPGEKGTRISGGQKQRVAIARALNKEPRLLLLDEATSALDSTNEAIVQSSLDALMQGRTTVVIAHRLSTVVRATKILVLGDGVVLESGTHSELAADPTSAYARFMQHQLVAPAQQY
ncbi:hypothetical protein AB1Y20_001035 [Prymnesium parvum]|uniref:ATP-dependent transporter ycf16 n=1 Tax=Prymnesium parvum TaxID=97485 RepID=A0AB34K6J8_PRYPA